VRGAKRGLGAQWQPRAVKHVMDERSREIFFLRDEERIEYTDLLGQYSVVVASRPVKERPTRREVLTQALPLKLRVETVCPNCNVVSLILAIAAINFF
jgi:hypothetical protein